ncbi:MAG: NADH-quinone oxidoreductase subunit L [Planctomycetota bacterium]|nr:MAG: NADH-quinone oxidoreductase subunit L [Planctomycetota bacterium]
MLQFDPAIDFKLLLAVPLIPLVGFAIQIFFGKKLPRKGDWMLITGMFVVMCITLYMAAKAISAGYAGKEFFHDSLDHGWGFKWLYSDRGAEAFSGNIVGGILYDGLGAGMLAVVGVVSFFVHLFSSGYMQGDRRYHIFFANISLFTFAMLGLVLADNLLFLFIFWELMGLMSYLLIGHFSHDPGSPRIKFAAAACKKAFLTTRVGDTCLFMGMVILYYHFGTLRFTELWELSRQAVEANNGDYPAWLTTAGLLCLGGTIGKSAQFPLHIWLPDAMEGPTPVSAMIHAATMVAAGVFLTGRLYPVFSPEVLQIAALAGGVTALYAATIGTTINDIKGVLAYSTISQLGFMVAAVGVGGVVPGMFHMLTHAFFKACLFLCAGSVIHGCHHEQDMRKMGGLRKFMPITFACMLLSTIAIAGIPLFSGFYSKDAIIAAAFERNMTIASSTATFVSIALPAAALLTAFYMFRLIFMTFFGEYRGGHAEHHVSLAVAGHGAHAGHADAGHAAHGHDEHGHEQHGHGHDHGAHDHGGHAHGAADHGGHDHGGHDHGHAHVPHESPKPMTIALIVLAFLGVFGGHFWLATPTDPLAHHGTWFTKVVSLESMYGAKVADFVEARQAGTLGTHAVAHDPAHAEHAQHAAHDLAVIVSLSVAGAGILLAALMYLWRKIRPEVVVGAIQPLYELVAHKYYWDEIVNLVAIKPTVALALTLKWVDEKVVDGVVLLVGHSNRALATFWAWFDRTFVDGLVNFVGLVSQSLGAIARLLQTGRIQQYAAFAVGGGLLAAAWLILG